MQEFHPIIMRECFDVAQNLERISNLYVLPFGTLSFDILEVRTFRAETNEIDSKPKLTKIESNELDSALQSTCSLKQSFDISVRSAKKEDLIHFVALSLHTHNTRANLVLKAGLEIREDETFFENLYMEVARQQALQKIIIEPESKVKKARIMEILKKGIETLKQENILSEDSKLSKEFSFELFASEYVPSLPLQAEFYPKIAWEKANDTTMEFASFAVIPNDLVLRLNPPQNGVSGRDLLGDYKQAERTISNVEQEVKMPEIKYPQGAFSKSDGEDGSALYHAQVLGYVSFLQDELKLLDEKDFKEVSLRSTGNLLGGREKGITLSVTSPNPNDDALGKGTILEAAVVDIVGCIGEKCRIFANDLKVHGQTHQSSYLEAKTCEIDFHKGSVRADSLKIKQSQLGSIDAGSVEIGELSGGSVRAKEIKIEKLHSNAKLYFSHLLEIKLLDGGENELYISPRAYFEDREKIETNTQFMQDCVDKINRLLELLSKDNATIKRAKPIITQLKAIMAEKKRLNEPIDKRITKAVAEYILIIRHAQFLKERIHAIQASAKTCDMELKALDEKLKGAKILNFSKWHRHNDIFYEHLFPQGRDMMSLENEEQCNICIEELKLKRF